MSRILILACIFLSASLVFAQTEEDYFHQSKADYEHGNLIRAIYDLNKAIEINPKDAKVYDARGIVYYRQEKFIQAIADFTNRRGQSLKWGQGNERLRKDKIQVKSPPPRQK